MFNSNAMTLSTISEEKEDEFRVDKDDNITCQFNKDDDLLNDTRKWLTNHNSDTSDNENNNKFQYLNDVSVEHCRILPRVPKPPPRKIIGYTVTCPPCQRYNSYVQSNCRSEGQLYCVDSDEDLTCI